jgi:chorismate dehydratase
LLMIGDRAMRPPNGNFVAEWDLGDVWCRWSKLPFVFAMWAARQEPGVGGRESGGEMVDLATLLTQARDSGMANVEKIAAAEHTAVGLSYDECLAYLREHLHFYLGRRELAGLRLFQERAAGLGLASPSGAGIRVFPVVKRQAGIASPSVKV